MMPSSVDHWGSLASFVCGVHCAGSALAPQILAGLGGGLWLSHEMEWGFTLVALGLAAWALLSGWRRHGSADIVAALGAGILGLLLARGLEELGYARIGTFVAMSAAVVLIVAHVANGSAGPRPPERA